MATLDYIVGEGWQRWTIGKGWERWTIGYVSLQVPDYASYIKQPMDFFTMIIVGKGWERWTIGYVGTLDYRVY